MIKVALLGINRFEKNYRQVHLILRYIFGDQRSNSESYFLSSKCAKVHEIRYGTLPEIFN